MEIPVLIERVRSEGYRVSGTTPFPFAVEAATREDALDKARELLRGREADGVEVGVLRIETPADRAPRAGFLKDDPMLGDWLEGMKAHRDRINAEEGP